MTSQGGRGRGRGRGPPREYTINPDSNYRKYYLNDVNFFKKVIDKEPAPYEFKIHLFKYERPDKSGESVDFEKYELPLLGLLKDYEIIDIKSSPLPDRLKVLFKIEQPELAKKCLADFHQFPYLNKGEDVVKIYLVKPGK